MVSALADLPGLSAAAVSALLEHVAVEPERSLRRQLLDVLLALSELSPPVLEAVWHLVPYDPGILKSLESRLASVPALGRQVAAAFSAFGSGVVKLEVLKLANAAGLTTLVVAALSDSSVAVRSLAADLAASRMAQEPPAAVGRGPGAVR